MKGKCDRCGAETSYKTIIQCRKCQYKYRNNDYLKYRDFSGDKNPFFGRYHSKETIEKIKIKGKERIRPLFILNCLQCNVEINSKVPWTRYCITCRKKISARKMIGDHTNLEWEKLKEEYSFTCAICGIREKELCDIYDSIRYQKLTKDHIVPVSKNGTNYIENIQPVCLSCNASKSDKDIDIIYCCGVFDLFHTGHLKLLERAKACGGYLIVGVVKDLAIKNQKGINRPTIEQDHRLSIVRAMKYVNKTMFQETFDPTENIKYLISKGLKINVFVLGEDQSHVNTSNLEGLGLKKIQLARTPGISTSDIIRKIKGE